MLRLGLLGLFVAAAVSAQEVTGEKVYAKKCASCHGDAGQGTKVYKRPLLGDKSIPQLTQLIAKTMPEDNPGTCVGPEAEAVAKYIHEAFYSVAARERNAPPRVELARLTVKQYRQSLADLVGTFRPVPKSDGKPGLRGEYFASRNFDQGKRRIDRVDPEVAFDYGSGTPSPGAFEKHEFSMRWEGSVSAPETGEYQFIVRTEHSLRLWVNSNRVPLIDAWVKSGSDTEFKGSIYLVAGRSYPLRLEFTKSQQGVNDPKRAKERAVFKASIALLWQLPHRVPEVIPARHLSSSKATETYVCSTPFPPDDRSMGWERGTTVSKAWDQATTEGALDAASYVMANANEFAGTKADAMDRAGKLKAFALRFVERAFRRSLSAEEKQLYVERPFESPEPEFALKRVVILTLKSPRFLYREVTGRDGFAVASRLSFALWDSIPDGPLLDAAGSGKLNQRYEVLRQAERMMNDPRAKVKLREFLHAWLKLDHVTDVMKDAHKYPGFDPLVVGDLQTSLDLFLDEKLWSPTSDFRQLLLDEQLILNGRLAAFYKLPGTIEESLRAAFALVHPTPGMLPKSNKPFEKMSLNADQRAGVLTHPYLLSAFAYTGSTSPIHRGVFLARGVLGIGLKPPPDAFTPLAAELHPTLTTRERIALQTKPAACQTCHNVINPLGFTLERFDPVGRYREMENGKAIDAAGQYETRTGSLEKFLGPRELAQFLAKSDEVHNAFAEQMFHHLVQQSVRAYGNDTLRELRESFARNEFNMRKLAIDIAVRASGFDVATKDIGK